MKTQIIGIWIHIKYIYSPLAGNTIYFPIKIRVKHLNIPILYSSLSFFAIMYENYKQPQYNTPVVLENVFPITIHCNVYVLCKLLWSVCNSITMILFHYAYFWTEKSEENKTSAHSQKNQDGLYEKSVVVKNGFLYRRYSLNCKFTPFTLTYLQKTECQ